MSGVALVAVVWITIAVGYGLFFSFSIFYVPLIAEFQWSRALTAGALSASTIVQGVTAPLAGVLVDRVGPRPVIVGGVVLLGASSLLNATIAAPWQLYLYTGVLGAIGLVAVGSLPMGVLLARRFAERRGRILGLAFSGMGVGVLVIGPVSQSLIAVAGWRVATAALGAGTLVLLLPLVWFGVHDVPAGRGTAAGAPPAASGPSLAQALRSRVFWALFAANFFTPLAVFPVSTHTVAFAVDVGFSAMSAAWAYGVMGFMSTVGRVGFGAAADRVGGPLAATLSFACSALGTLALLAVETSPRALWLGTFAILFGLGFGARGPIITALVGESFGGRHLGSIYGVVALGGGMGGAVGPWLGGAVHDATGSYRAAFLAAVAFAVVGSGCFWAARRRP